MSNTGLGNRIRARRKLLGLTQKQLAEKIGKVESTVRMWELGKNVPPADVIEKIAKILDINYVELMILANHMNSTDVTKLLIERDKLEAKRTEIRDKKEKLVEKIKKIKFQLEKFDDIDDEELTAKEFNERYILWKEKRELISQTESLRDQSEDLGIEIDEINDMIRKLLETKEYERTNNIIGHSIDESKIDIESIFSSSKEITINGKRLTDEEKQKALLILKLTFDK